MADNHELALVADWLYDTLSGDATLQTALGASGRIHHGAIPQGGSYPAVVFSLVEPHLVRGIGQETIMVDALYQVVAHAEGRSYSDLITIVNRIRTLLHGSSGATAAGSVLAVTREDPIEDGVDGNPSYRMLGDEYRIYAQSA